MIYSEMLLKVVDGIKGDTVYLPRAFLTQVLIEAKERTYLFPLDMINHKLMLFNGKYIVLYEDLCKEMML